MLKPVSTRGELVQHDMEEKLCEAGEEVGFNLIFIYSHIF